MAININDLKKLRELTSAGVSDCRQALEDAGGDFEKAKKLVAEKSIEKAAKKADRETGSGLISSYIHGDKVGVLVEVRCETDFVARTDDYKHLCHEIALQVAAMNPKDVKALLESAYVRDPKLTIEGLIKQTIGKLGENITLARFHRMTLGEK